MSGDNAPRLLDVAVRAENGTAIVTVQGEVDMASAPQLQAALEDAQRGGDPLVVDMSEVGFLGSAGLSVLLVISEAAEPAAGLRVVVSDAVRRPVELTGLDKLLSVHESLADALAAGANPAAS
ncbi:STAS domain-containing protein [Nocardia fusca]|uniref:STAS domain-containing protein n=1 Tax=Nocardia fusca TaxID=941183 RepID=UPI0007A735A3|nr:STAS domain-containing protein [Nocardia fusca]